MVNFIGYFYYGLKKGIYIYIYNSLLNTRKEVPLYEIKKLSLKFSMYLKNNHFYDYTVRTDWPSLECYKDKESRELLGL